MRPVFASALDTFTSLLASVRPAKKRRSEEEAPEQPKKKKARTEEAAPPPAAKGNTKRKVCHYVKHDTELYERANPEGAPHEPTERRVVKMCPKCEHYVCSKCMSNKSSACVVCEKEPDS